MERLWPASSYTTDSRSELSDQGRAAYQAFQQAVYLRQARTSQVLILTERCHGHSGRLEPPHDPNAHQSPSSLTFSTALHLIPTVEAVVEYNVAQFQASGQPIGSSHLTQCSLMMQEYWRQSSALPSQHVLCSPATSGLMLASSMEQWELSTPSVTGLVDHLTATLAPLSMAAQYPSLLFAACSCPSSWHPQVSRSDIGKKPFSTGLTFIACSPVRCLLLYCVH